MDSKFKLLPTHLKPEPTITHCIMRHLSWSTEFNGLLHELGLLNVMLEELWKKFHEIKKYNEVMRLLTHLIGCEDIQAEVDSFFGDLIRHHVQDYNP